MEAHFGAKMEEKINEICNGITEIHKFLMKFPNLGTKFTEIPQFG